MHPEIYHPIKNHCFKPWNDLIWLSPSCSVKSPSSLPTLMRVRPQGLSWRLLTSACPADVAFLGRDPAAVVLSVINIPLSHLPPPSRGKWHRAHWLGCEPGRGRSRGFYHVPHERMHIDWLLNFLPQVQQLLIQQDSSGCSSHLQWFKDSRSLQGWTPIHQFLCPGPC